MKLIEFALVYKWVPIYAKLVNMSDWGYFDNEILHIMT